MRDLTRLLRAVPRRLRRWLRPTNPHPEPLRTWAAGAGPLTVLDVGANCGQFATDLAGWFPVARAWLVEPQRRLTDELTRRFPPPRFSVHWLALADRAGTVELEVSRGMDMTASLLPIKADLPELRHLPLGVRETETCPVDTLDHFTAGAGIDRLDLLKLDTQGNELQVLRGGAQTLARTRAVWVELSFVQLYDGACLIHEVIEHLHARQLYLRGLAPEFLGPAGELLQVNGLFTRAPEPK